MRPAFVERRFAACGVLQWQPTRTTHLYVVWDKGFRSGGYNFRSTETVSRAVTKPGGRIEGGWKQEFAGGRARLNLAGSTSTWRIPARDQPAERNGGRYAGDPNAGNARIWARSWKDVARDAEPDPLD